MGRENKETRRAEVRRRTLRSTGEPALVWVR